MSTQYAQHGAHVPMQQQKELIDSLVRLIVRQQSEGAPAVGASHWRPAGSPATGPAQVGASGGESDELRVLTTKIDIMSQIEAMLRRNSAERQVADAVARSVCTSAVVPAWPPRSAAPPAAAWAPRQPLGFRTRVKLQSTRAVRCPSRDRAVRTRPGVTSHAATCLVTYVVPCVVSGALLPTTSHVGSKVNPTHQ
jgi:hypothetical protein